MSFIRLRWSAFCSYSVENEYNELVLNVKCFFYICGDHHVVFVLYNKVYWIDFLNVKPLYSLNKSHLVYSPFLLLLLIQRKVNMFSCSVGCLSLHSLDSTLWYTNLLNCDEVQLLNISCIVFGFDITFMKIHLSFNLMCIGYIS